jgi:hypothetical protein
MSVCLSGKLLLVLSSTVILGSGSRGTHDHYSLGLVNCCWPSPAQSLVSSPMGPMTVFYYLMTLRVMRPLFPFTRLSVGQFAAGARQHSKSWFQVPLSPWPYFCSFQHFCVLKWGLLFNERRSHSPSAGGNLSQHSLTGPLLHCFWSSLCSLGADQIEKTMTSIVSLSLAAGTCLLRHCLLGHQSHGD